MSFQLTSLGDLAAQGFDDIIDVRSPAEFAADRVPGAISLPVLDNDERARVGTMYTRESRFGARKMGAALVVRNVARHLEVELADRDGGWRPLVYCWRGGQRSGTFAWILREIGWRVEVLDGGYRSYRRLISRMLYEQPLAHRFVVLEGMTCTAKTEILHRLAARGAQVLDLEGLARHRGSIFGAQAEPQPSQKGFESEVAQVLAGVDATRPVIVESESSKVGNLTVPPQVWALMRAAPRVSVRAPLKARAAFFPQAYPDLVTDPATFSEKISRLRTQHGGAQVAAWQAMVADAAFEDVAGELMRHHYDPRYAKSQARHAESVVASVDLDSLAPAALDAALPRLESALSTADGRRG